MKNSNHASKALAVVLSGALAFAPAANAALDESNMAYTSAAEGFYGSLRVQYANNDNAGGKDNDATVEAEGSRLGVRGDIDLGGGLGAFYGFEWNLGGPANGDRANAAKGTGLNTRQHHVGLKGDWGSVWLGAFDSVIVRFGGFSTTDILDQYSGNYEPIYRTGNAVAYVSPDLNGFNFGIEVHAKDGDNVVDGKGDDGNDFDNIGFGASYSIQGLNFSGAYYQQQDALALGEVTGEVSFGGTGATTRTKAGDKGQYALGLSYSQDNWIVAAMYGAEDTSVPTTCGPVTGARVSVAVGVDSCATANGGAGTNGRNYKESDATFFSLAAGVSIDKLDIHGLWEQKTYEDALISDSNTGEFTNIDLSATPPIESPIDTVAITRKDAEQTIMAITARYHLGSKARLRAGWKNTETDDRTGKAQDNTSYALGMRVDF